ncbi:beta-xylosidase [Actinocorallia herbida]|uniref:Beta-xylosidase n=1 Tax=Actinocorallia herbida TaxID=58109 RepID=A0A3N1D274_9ACTN|nr:glycoside hydrolase family 43 protein [Actinocorallia herbida]ROO87633.1 beta-xylosidase [Actinocorallia herbida]
MTRPVIPGFNPDPSVVRVGADYYLVTSSFEYLPGLPVYHSTDLRDWRQIGHVATRPEQVDLDRIPTPGGVWAPTLRYRDGLFHLIVTVFLGGRGCVVFTAADPAGPWSDGVPIPAVDGIDPDLAWDDDGTAIVTFARYPEPIQQVRVDLATGRALGPPRAVWAGSGRYAPEGPHLYRRGDWWYLVAAEGGTDRGHAVTVARARRPDGPFESCPGNPVLSAAGTGWEVQNLGHADLVETDSGTALVCLGVRPVGLAKSFSPLGRETFLADVDWADGWPSARLAEVPPGPAEEVIYDLGAPDVLADPVWIAVRQLPTEVAAPTPGGLLLRRTSGHTGLDGPRPAFVGRRQRHLTAVVSGVFDVREGRGGLAFRNAEDNLVALEARATGTAVEVEARVVVAGFDRTWHAALPSGDVELTIAMAPPPDDFAAGAVGGDRIRLSARVADDEVTLAELDGRHWCFETAKAFTGRVVGPFAAEGSVLVRRLRYSGGP